MSEGNVKSFMDYAAGADSGLDDPTSIQPIENGEFINGGSGGVANRPSENLRARSELLRAVLNDLLYLVQADRSMVLGGTGRVTWPGSTTAAASGIPVLDNPIYLIPALTPGSAQTPPIPPVASVFGTISLLKSDNSPGLVVTSRRRTYDRGDEINITVVSATPLGAVVTGDRTIVLTAPAGTSLSQAITTLNGLTADASPTQLVTAALAGGASNSDLLKTPQAKQYMAGNIDGEGHAITPANLASFFSSNPTSALAEGDSLCIRYAMMVEAGGTGGRRQSTPENSNTAIPAGAFFNSRLNPEKLVNAIPLAKVISGRLVFAGAIQVPAGVTNFDLTNSTAASLTYAGGGNWRDGTTNPSTSVEGQLDKIITDLASITVAGAGIHKIGCDPEGYTFGSLLAQTLAARLAAFDDAKANLIGAAFTGAVGVDIVSENDDGGFAFVSSTAPVSAYKPLFHFQGPGSVILRALIRLSDGALVVTVNAAWRTPGAGHSNTWARDDTSKTATYFAFGRNTFTIKQQLAGASSWADGAWDATPFVFDSTPGGGLTLTSGISTASLFSSGDCVAAGDVASATMGTAAAALRHGDQTLNTINAISLDPVAGWVLINAIGVFHWEVPASNTEQLLIPLELKTGDRVKEIKLWAKTAGGVATDLTANYIHVVDAVGTPVFHGGTVPLPASTTAKQYLTIDVTGSPVIIGATDKHYILLAPANTSGAKSYYGMSVRYDHP